jgi:predicted transcriptional regulator of viral defense system
LRKSKKRHDQKSLFELADHFTFSDLEQACPGVSRDMVRKVLKDMKKAGKVKRFGRGPGTLWRKEGNILERG